MPAENSCISRDITRSEPVRCTSTLMPGCAASNSLATFSALGSASDVYQTTLPSFFAASRRASWAEATGATASEAISASAHSSVGSIAILRWGQGPEHFGQRRAIREPVDGPDHALHFVGGQGEAGIPAELRLDLGARQRRVGPAVRAVLALAQRAPVGEGHLD